MDLEKNVLWFSEISSQDVLRVGARGINLGKLARAGVSTPRGFCITSSAYSKFCRMLNITNEELKELDLNKALIESREIRQLFLKYPLPLDITKDIRENYKKLIPTSTTDPKVSLHSSIIHNSENFYKNWNEYNKSFFNISGIIDLENTIKSCWAYFWSNEAIEYRFYYGIPLRIDDIFIIVQTMINPISSGIAYTINPITQNGDEIFIESCWGFNEIIRLGIVNPDRFLWNCSSQKIIEKEINSKDQIIVVNGKKMEIIPTEQERKNKESIDIEDIKSLITKIEKLKKFFDFPMDIEWSLEDKKIYILQVYPVYISDITINHEDTEEWNFSVSSKYFKEPISPLAWSIIEPKLRKSLENALNILNFKLNLPSNKYFKSINNYIHINKNIITGLKEIFPINSDFFNPNLSGWKILISNHNLWKYFIMFWKVKILWYRTIKQYIKDIKQLWLYDYNNASTQDLLSQLDKIINISDKLFISYALIKILKTRLITFMSNFLNSYFPDNSQEYLKKLLSGLPNRTLATNRALIKLIDTVKESPEVKNIILNEPLDNIMENLKMYTSGEKFIKALTDFLGKYGYKEVFVDPIFPTWIEKPTIVLETIKQILKENKFEDDLVSQRELIEEKIFKSLGFDIFKRLIIEQMINLSQTYVGIDEDEHYYITMYLPLLRKILLTLSNYLNLEQKEDIFYLTINEIKDAIRFFNPSKRNMKKKIEKRKNEREIFLQISPYVMFSKNIRKIKSKPCSFGVQIGKIRKISRNESTIDISHGEILITEYIPINEELFEKISGIIVEKGAILSYGAMLSRKYNIPVVIASNEIISNLNTGQIIKINGYTGDIIILNEKV